MAMSNEQSDDQQDIGDIDLVVDVMLGEPGGSTFNTVVLGGTDIVIPVERDAHADPFQDDEVWLRSMDGGVEYQLGVDHPNVEEDEDKGLLMYRFEHVPFGVYSAFVVTAGVAVETMRHLVVRREGVFLGDKQLSDTHDGKPMAPPPTDDDADDAGDEQAETADASGSSNDESSYIDQYDHDEDMDG
jgi:hypothetical protein